MKITYGIVIVLLAGIILARTSVAHAQWSAINSGYAVTTDKHGQEVVVGESVAAWAGTTNSGVYQIQFVWKWKNSTDNSTHIKFNVNVTDIYSYTTPDCPPETPPEIIDWAKNNTGITIYYANNTQIPDEIGEWAVQVFFYAPGGHLMGNSTDIIKIKATSFETVPNIPVLGTAGAIIAMLLSLVFFKNKKYFLRGKA